MLRLHFTSTSNEIILVGDHMKSDFYRRSSYQNSSNQVMTDIQLRLPDYEVLFHLMLRLYVASTLNEITLVGDYMEEGLFHFM